MRPEDKAKAPFLTNISEPKRILYHNTPAMRANPNMLPCDENRKLLTSGIDAPAQPDLDGVIQNLMAALGVDEAKAYELATGKKKVEAMAPPGDKVEIDDEEEPKEKKWAPPSQRSKTEWYQYALETFGIDKMTEIGIVETMPKSDMVDAIDQLQAEADLNKG